LISNVGGAFARDEFDFLTRADPRSPTPVI
jgi:hypothetical protein